MSELEFQKTLVVSINHMTKKDSTVLEINGGDSIVDAYPFGWATYISEDIDELYQGLSEDMSDHFKSAMKLAHEHKCQWLKFDADGNVVDKLETFNW